MEESRKKLFLGIDPGVSGAWAIVREDSELVTFNLWEHRHLLKLSVADVRAASLEKVGAMPGQGVVSMFTFGHSAGVWQGMLEAFEIPYELVTPQKWQKAILSTIPAKVPRVHGADRNEDAKRRRDNRALLKAATVGSVERRYPQLRTFLSVKKNWGVADAVCLALFARLRYIGSSDALRPLADSVDRPNGGEGRGDDLGGLDGICDYRRGSSDLN